MWDDIDIVHVVREQIQDVNNLHTYGGIRLQSSADASLVVKLQNTTIDNGTGGLQCHPHQAYGCAYSAGAMGRSTENSRHCRPIDSMVCASALESRAERAGGARPRDRES